MLRWLIFGAVFLGGCGGAVVSSEPIGETSASATTLPPEAAVTSTTSPPPHSTTTTGDDDLRGCLGDAPFRSWYAETADGYASEVLREIDGTRAQWTFTQPAGEGEPALGLIRLGDDVWNLVDGAWEPFPVVPIRLPLMVWVNGYVNGPDVAAHLLPGDTEEVAGISATVYRGGVEEMTAAFPGKMRDREFVADLTTYTYWVDDCGELLRADVLIELGGEEREIAEDADLPTTYRYQYLVYDIGAAFDIAPPLDGAVPVIPPPPDRDLEPPRTG